MTINLCFLCGFQRDECSFRPLGCTEDELEGWMDEWVDGWKNRVMKIPHL